MKRHLEAALLAAFSLAWIAPSRAQGDDTPKIIRSDYSPYELETIGLGLRDRIPNFPAEDARAVKEAIDPEPDGKFIEAIDIVRFEVFEERDPLPSFARGIANTLHYTSRDRMIRRALLLHQGDLYLTAIAEETARNLRGIGQISVALAVPIRGSAPDRVRWLIVTKDIWSLRLAWDVSATPGGIEKFTLNPQEQNLLGLHHTLSTKFVYQPLSDSFGAGYAVPRFGNSWVGATTGVGMTINTLGQVEGTAGSLTVGQPLYSTRTPWGWSASGSWDVGVFRRYSNAKLVGYDSKLTPAVDPVPFAYRSRSASIGASAVRSFGWRFKNDFQVAYSLRSSGYSLLDGLTAPQVAIDDFTRRFLPVGDTRSGPVLQWHTYTTNFTRILDFQTLALQEDIRLGHDIYAQVYPVLEALGSSRNLVGAYLGAQYTVALGDGFARASVESISERQINSGAEDSLTDASIQGTARVVTPRFGLGRIVMDATYFNRYRNYLNRLSFLGGDGRLRGYPTNALAGKDAVAYNIEYRSRPLEILSCEFGFAAFYDVGDAATGVGNLHPLQAVGAGIRALFPQLDRRVFRFDLAFPFDRRMPDGTLVSPVAFYFGFDQAFGGSSFGP